MNIITKEGVTALAVTERAAIAMQSSLRDRQLVELAASTQDIVAVTNKDGREQCHRAYMVAKDSRIEIEKLAKAARDDANNFSKACVAEEGRLVALIKPEEDRLKTLRDAFDKKEADEKAAKKAAEEARIAAIKAKIQRFEELVMTAALKQFSADVKKVLAEVEAIEIDDSFEEFFGEANEARGKAKQTLQAVILAKETAEQVAAEVAEQNRKMQEQLAELQRQNAELAKNQAPKAEEVPVVLPQEATKPTAKSEVMPSELTITEPVVPFITHGKGTTTSVASAQSANSVPAEFGGAAPDPVVQAEGIVAEFLNSREWKSAADRNHARAICIEFSKFQAVFREAA